MELFFGQPAINFSVGPDKDSSSMIFSDNLDLYFINYLSKRLKGYLPPPHQGKKVSLTFMFNAPFPPPKMICWAPPVSDEKCL